MYVKIKLNAHYRVGRFKESVENYPEGTSVGDSLKGLRIMDTTSGIVLLNGCPAQPDQLLHDGDTLALFPIVSGG